MGEKSNLNIIADNFTEYLQLWDRVEQVTL